jgi:DNA invertase Pin-like site-specific DNA recombinase
MRAFAYCRVSSRGQVDGDGFARQEQAIYDYAATHNLSIENIYRDYISGTLEERPALAEMMVSMEKNGHGIDTVIIEKADRLARDLMVQEAIIADFKKHGFHLISVHEGDLIAEHGLLSEDPTRKLIRQIFGAIAEYDKTMTVLKLRVARERVKARQGKCEGRKGYTEAAPEIIETIKLLRKKPRGQKRLTFVQVAEELNRKGHRTLTGRPFTGQVVQNILQGLK